MEMENSEKYNYVRSLTMQTIFTIGYATKTIDSFVAALKKHGVTSVVDVRTSPFSAAFPMFNRDSLKSSLREHGIVYLSFSDEFGARRSEKNVYVDSYDMKTESLVKRVSFEKVYQLDIFKQGVKRIQNAYLKGHKVCFLCSEKRPSDCHRFIMVASYFKTLGFEVINIISDAENWTYDQTIKNLAEEMDQEERRFRRKHPGVGEIKIFDDPDTEFEIFMDEFFRSGEPVEKRALRFGNLKIGYMEGASEND